MVRGRSSWKTWKTTRNLADYEGPLRRGRICRAVCPSLLSRSRIFWVKSSRRGSLSLSLSSARFCWRCEITKDEKEERSRGVLCEDDPSGGPMPRKPRVPRTQRFRTRLVRLLSPLLPNSPSFLSSLAGGFPVRSSGQIRSRKDFLRREYFKRAPPTWETWTREESFNLRGWVCRHLGRVKYIYIFLLSVVFN